MLQKVDCFFECLEECAGAINNEHIRLYATGIFQKFEQYDQEQLITHVFVDYGLYFNVIPPDLEQFYKEKSEAVFGSQNIVYGLILQEFRRVVICGSFQGRGAVRARYIGGILAGRLAEVQQNRFIQNLGQPHKEMG